MSNFVPKEVVEQAKQIDLLTYFMNNNPSELVKKGTGTYSLKSQDCFFYKSSRENSSRLSNKSGKNDIFRGC